MAKSTPEQSEKRQYPRISIPLLVEIKHPILGSRRCIASNVSAGGLFVTFDDGVDTAGIKVQSRLKASLVNTNQVEPHPTPTVDMVVMRVESNGLGLKFANETSRFLWESAERRRVELAIGRDYFQVHVSALISRDRRLLLVERKGRWVFPRLLPHGRTALAGNDRTGHHRGVGPGGPCARRSAGHKRPAG